MRRMRPVSGHTLQLQEQLALDGAAVRKEGASVCGWLGVAGEGYLA